MAFALIMYPPVHLHTNAGESDNFLQRLFNLLSVQHIKISIHVKSKLMMSLRRKKSFYDPKSPASSCQLTREEQISMVVKAKL